MYLMSYVSVLALVQNELSIELWFQSKYSRSSIVLVIILYELFDSILFQCCKLDSLY